MTDPSKMSSEDLIVNYKRAVCNINWRDKANLENYRFLTEELMRRLAVYDQLILLPPYGSIVEEISKWPINEDIIERLKRTNNEKPE